MLRFFLLVIAGLVLGSLFVLAEAMRRPLVRLLRGFLLGLVAVLLVGGLALTVTGISEEAWWAAIIGGGILLAALRLGWALRRPRRRDLEEQPEHVPLTRSAPDPHWRRFEAKLDWVGRQQARRSRSSIEGFVAERNSPSLNHEQKSLLLSCEKRVPELIETCLERCGNADWQERERYVDETLDTLIQIGRQAERARREVREADDQRLQVLHRYFDGVAGDGDERPR